MAISNQHKRAAQAALERNRKRKLRVPVDNGDSKTQARRRKRALGDYSYFVKTYFLHLAPSPCADYHLKLAEDIREAVESSSYREVISEIFRGGAKTTHTAVLIQAWLSARNRAQLVTVLVSMTEDGAVDLADTLRHELGKNELLNEDFPHTRLDPNCDTASYFATMGGHAWMAYGRGQRVRGINHHGIRPTCILVDDIDDPRICANPSNVDKLQEFIWGDLVGTMAAGRGAVCLSGNRHHPDCVIAREADKVLSKIKKHKKENPGTAPYVNYRKINALDEKQQSNWPDRYPTQELLSLSDKLPLRRWLAEFMNAPVISGAVFNDDDIIWRPREPWEVYSAHEIYCDLSFGNSQIGDYKAMVHGALRHNPKTGKHEYDIVGVLVRQCSMVDFTRLSLTYWNELPEGVRALGNFRMEGNHKQDLFWEDYEQAAQMLGTPNPVVVDVRTKPKKADRITGSHKYFHQKRVFFDEGLKYDADMMRGMTQLLNFDPANRHGVDDYPDAQDSMLFWLSQRGGGVFRATDRQRPSRGRGKRIRRRDRGRSGRRRTY